MKRGARHTINAILVIAVLVWIYLVFMIGPSRIVDIIGVKNAYAILFVAGFISGFTSTAYVTLYPAAISFAVGGMGIISISFVSALGMTTSNMLFFYFGKEGRFLGDSGFRKKADQIYAKIKCCKPWVMPLIFYVYAAVVPLPNAVIIATAGLLKYPFRKLPLPFLLGNMTYVLLVVYLALKGIMIIS